MASQRLSSPLPTTTATAPTSGVAPLPFPPRYPSPSSPSASETYSILPQHHSLPRKLRILSIGAGASGLCLAYKLQKQLSAGSWELAIYEKNGQIGGTWFENTYPGVACDIPSHDYNFTWDPKCDWSHFFAHGEEIRGYFEGFAERFGCNKYIQLNSKIVSCRWDEAEGIWNVTIEDTATGKRREDWAHILVNGAGILNTWKWPDIAGLHSFKGQLMHSAKWNHDVKFEGKKVAVIGVGSTSVQITPALQKVVGSLEVFIRSSTWISPPFGAGALQTDLQRGQDVDPGQRQYTFSDADKQRFKEDPEYHLDFRKRIEAEINSLFAMYKQGSDMSHQFRKVITDEMNRRIGPGHEELKSRIIPPWSPGCRRISPGDGFLEALTKDNVRPVFSGVMEINEKGILDESGEQHDFDIIVCATGFQIAFEPAFEVINGEGRSISEDWSDGPNMYMGVSAPRFPNYYTIVGPGATWSNGSLIPSIETTIEYVVQIIKKVSEEQIKAIEVKQEALDDLYAHFDEFHKGTVWQEGCSSWYKNSKYNNRIYLWPGSTIHFLKSIKRPRYEDYNIRYRYKNRFAYLGNGDVKGTASRDVQMLSPYVRNSDHDWEVE